MWRIDVATLAFASSIVAGANAGGVTPIAGVAGDAVRGFVWRVG